MPASTEPELIAGTSPPAPAPGAAPSPPTTPAPESSADTGGNFFADLQDLTGIDFSATCATPEDALKALGQAYKERDGIAGDAQYGRQIRQALSGREQEVLKFLASQKEPTSTKRSISDFPEDARNWRYQITRDEKGNLAPVPGAPSTIVQDYQAYQEALTERLDQIARNFGQVEALPEQIGRQAAQVQQSAAMQAESNAIDRLERQYGDFLYAEPPDADGNVVFSEAGKKVKAEFDRLSARPSLANVPVSERLLLAISRITDSQPNFKAPKPNGRAVRTPGAATTASESYSNTEQEWADRIKKARENNRGFADVCRDMVAARAKPTIG